MNILNRIFEIDYHMAKSDGKRGLILETPAKPEFLPAIVSTLSPGRFLVTDKLTTASRIRSGIFKSAENLDIYIPEIYSAALSLSESQQWPNRYETLDQCLDYIRKQSELSEFYPSVLMSSDSWADLCDLSGLDPAVENYRGSSVYITSIPGVMVFSRSDLVGLITQFTGSYASLVMHNVKMGVAFVI